MNIRQLIPAIVFTLCYAVSLQGQPASIMIVGSDHLAQLYDSSHPNTDVFNRQRQAEIRTFVAAATQFRPDAVMVEVLPARQAELDSLYRLYAQDKLSFESLKDGRSEVYQLAFRIGRQSGLPVIFCVNAPGGTSQSILDNGDRIQLFKEEEQSVRRLVMEKMHALRADSLSLHDYLLFLNQPATYNRVYRLRYMTPARVTNGTFKNPDAMVDTAFIDKKYIGAELAAIYKTRDYKIYSNIVTTQLQTGAKRILLIIGAAHVGSLKSMFRDDPAFELADTEKILRSFRKSPGRP